MPVQGKFDVELNNVGYMLEIDEQAGRVYKRTTEETFVPAQDTSTKKGVLLVYV